MLVRERATQERFAVKVMNKEHLLREHQYENITVEREVLRRAGPHPFIVECHSGFQTDDVVVLVLEYLSGGDMYDMLAKYGTLSEEEALFYLSELIVAIGELHRFKFVWRDVKLENILLDSKGHIRLTDFGLAGKYISTQPTDASIKDVSGTCVYQAPEILSRKGHGRLVDWWALGILAYILVTGRPPFRSDDRSELFRKIEEEELDLSTDERTRDLSENMRDFIQRLLVKDVNKRLGSEGDVEEVKQHPLFEGVNWDALVKMEHAAPLEAPLQPPLSGDNIRKKEAEKRLEEVMQRKLKLRKQSPDLADFKTIRRETKTRRNSIGLDFSNAHTEQNRKTWLGTTDDFGRVASTDRRIFEKESM
eukprot:Plantae.Rhodophyta-Purpureofilum_apyrenoidigerum.ctg32018.p1 GENE.Plantae.Rhodophyta-Purpureofilum_apyrenoidigerum.ctg32018~~Plantae.Rhodophyta-Purpureofilum_apyrenoidigerum.ctg32018.p1  ORF type:complete len:364 (+),score=81.21 Plantae.Rhodophyta-Purpureofilum_apyrenoidigerum.ctg32018:138-1229(+)